MLKRSIAAFAFVALAIAVTAWILWTSLDFQQCVESNAQNNRASQHLKEGVPIVSMIQTYRHCVGIYVTDKNAVITALGTVIVAIFTAVLGIFTISLAGSTRIAANAAKESADALAQSERAQLFIIVGAEKIEALIRPIRLSIQANETKEESEIVGREQTTTVECTFKNYGKTPAIVKEISIHLAYYDSLPTKPTYVPRDTVLSQFMIAGGEMTDIQPCELTSRLTRAQANRVVRAQTISGTTAGWCTTIFLDASMSIASCGATAAATGSDRITNTKSTLKILSHNAAFRK